MTEISSDDCDALWQSPKYRIRITSAAEISVRVERGNWQQ